ncbi:MarR family winged helix-turn-helix transcriptional regulator [Nonomuraea sp. NPDC050663]|uniref:MarR family winged helix-turn-helix transcriptional regulator n=1 Tax=Nonomuraea sp. NPDC050663 TaxID=3364370 RepID=UPI0037A1A02E
MSDERVGTVDPRETDIRSWPTGRLLSVAARVVEARYHAYLATHGLTHAGLIALHHLREWPRTQRELATLCRVTDQTMSRTVRHLSRAGYVGRRPDEQDRRRTRVDITPAGADVLAMVWEAERGSDRLLGVVDDYEAFRRQLIQLITVT